MVALDLSKSMASRRSIIDVRLSRRGRTLECRSMIHAPTLMEVSGGEARNKQIQGRWPIQRSNAAEPSVACNVPCSHDSPAARPGRVHANGWRQSIEIVLRYTTSYLVTSDLGNAYKVVLTWRCQSLSSRQGCVSPLTACWYLSTDRILRDARTTLAAVSVGTILVWNIRDFSHR